MTMTSPTSPNATPPQCRAPDLEAAATFLYTNARTLERVLFATLFEDGPAEAVATVVRGYRNPDGGLGHALEPDARAPASLPLHCEIGLRALVDSGARDAALAAGIADYLQALAESDGRVPIVTSAVLGYPRAGHWDAPVAGGDSPNPTASLAGLLHALDVAHPWRDRATAWTWERLERPIGSAHDLLCALLFLDHVPDRERAKTLGVRLAGRAEDAALYQADPHAEGYGLTPLTLCPTPDCVGRPAFDDALIEAHLDALVGAQAEDGGWPLTHPAPGPAAGLEWRGRWTLDALATLRAYGRV